MIRGISFPFRFVILATLLTFGLTMHAQTSPLRRPTFLPNYRGPGRVLRLRQARGDDPHARRREAAHRHRGAEGREERADSLTRTPYNAPSAPQRNQSPHMLAILPQGDEVFVQDGYIRVFQDVRGKYGSEGDYLMTRPLRGPLNSTTTDDSTDAYDTIDWLVKNVPESNGRVGMLGCSYEGFTVVMALLDPHPALKVAAPEEPDGRRLDGRRLVPLRRLPPDQSGLFLRPDHQSEGEARHRRERLRRLREFSAAPVRPATSPRPRGLDQLPWWHKMTEHPAYDAFWQGQALDKTDGRAAARKCRPCGFRACGTRKTCGARSTATWRLKPKTRATT